MAGASNAIFREKLTPYLREHLADHTAIAAQYLASPLEQQTADTDRMRHYQAELHVEHEGKRLRGVERLYRRTLLVQPTMACAAHCRWCLRGQYPVFAMSAADIQNAARYCGSEPVRHEIRELLVTGGDPLIDIGRLRSVLAAFQAQAANVEIFRIATRLPLQDPARIDREVLTVLAAVHPARVEIATHINHPAELTPDAQAAFERLARASHRIYNQTVLLKGVNDDEATLARLYDATRYLGIESHYLFHCIPMRGMSHHRTSVQRGLEIAARLSSSGMFSGRGKPLYTAMTDIGKIALLHGTLLERNDRGEILLQSGYRADTFRAVNPCWTLPESAHADASGYLRVWYPDGRD
jgi:lysine 2,3-aminomutase